MGRRPLYNWASMDGAVEKLPIEIAEAARPWDHSFHEAVLMVEGSVDLQAEV